MDKQLTDIINRFKEFETYLKGIDIESFARFTPKELNELKAELQSIHLRSLGFEISKLIAEINFREHPELLGVHHFPALKEANFLTEAEQKEVDDYLAILRKGEPLSGISRLRFAMNTKKMFRLEQFLIEKGIVQQHHFVICPSCGDGYLTTHLTDYEKEQLEALLKQKPNTVERSESLSEIIQFACLECDHDIDLDTVQEVPFKTYLKMVAERDTQLLNA